MWFPKFVWSPEMFKFLCAIFIPILFVISGLVISKTKAVERYGKLFAPIVCIGGAIGMGYFFTTMF